MTCLKITQLRALALLSDTQDTLQEAKPGPASYLQEWLNNIFQEGELNQGGFLKLLPTETWALGEWVWLGGVIARAISMNDADQEYNFWK